MRARSFLSASRASGELINLSAAESEGLQLQDWLQSSHVDEFLN